MKKEWFVKTLALGIVVLFISISFQPVFAVDIKPSDKTVIGSLSGNDEKVEYVIQIVKTNKIIEHIVYLTQQEADDLEDLIDDIRSNLNGSKSFEDTNQIFYNAIDSFNGLGVFPDTISKNEIKQLVTGENRDLDKIRFKNEMDEGFENSNCHVTGETTNTYFIGPATLLLEFLTLLSNKLGYKFYIFFSLFELFGFLYIISQFIYEIFRYSIGGIVTIGEWVVDEVNDYYYPGEGWIHTHGKNGNNGFSGSFYGQISTRPGFWRTTLYTGIVGFTGIRIYKGDDIDYYLGYASKVHVGPERP